jgi:hypothetical protein
VNEVATIFHSSTILWPLNRAGKHGRSAARGFGEAGRPSAMPIPTTNKPLAALLGIADVRWDEPCYHQPNDRRPVATGRYNPRQRFHSHRMGFCVRGRAGVLPE